MMPNSETEPLLFELKAQVEERNTFQANDPVQNRVPSIFTSKKLENNAKLRQSALNISRSNCPASTKLIMYAMSHSKHIKPKGGLGNYQPWDPEHMREIEQKAAKSADDEATTIQKSGREKRRRPIKQSKRRKKYDDDDDSSEDEDDDAKEDEIDSTERKGTEKKKETDDEKEEAEEEEEKKQQKTKRRRPKSKARAKRTKKQMEEDRKKEEAEEAKDEDEEKNKTKNNRLKKGDVSGVKGGRGGGGGGEGTRGTADIDEDDDDDDDDIETKEEMERRILNVKLIRSLEEQVCHITDKGMNYHVVDLHDDEYLPNDDSVYAKAKAVEFEAAIEKSKKKKQSLVAGVAGGASGSGSGSGSGLRSTTSVKLMPPLSLSLSSSSLKSAPRALSTSSTTTTTHLTPLKPKKRSEIISDTKSVETVRYPIKARIEAAIKEHNMTILSLWNVVASRVSSETNKLLEMKKLEYHAYMKGRVNSRIVSSSSGMPAHLRMGKHQNLPDFAAYPTFDTVQTYLMGSPPSSHVLICAICKMYIGRHVYWILRMAGTHAIYDSIWMETNLADFVPAISTPEGAQFHKNTPLIKKMESKEFLKALENAEEAKNDYLKKLNETLRRKRSESLR